MNRSTFPIFEVHSYETELPVAVIVWHVRSVRPIRDPAVDPETITRIEFVDGGVLDCDETYTMVLIAIREALQPVIDYLGSVPVRGRRR